MLYRNARMVYKVYRLWHGGTEARSFRDLKSAPKTLEGMKAVPTEFGTASRSDAMN